MGMGAADAPDLDHLDVDTPALELTLDHSVKVRENGKAGGGSGRGKGKNKIFRSGMTFAQLAEAALGSMPEQKGTLPQIYGWIEQRHPFYKTAPTTWKNSLRHNLSSKGCFKRVSVSGVNMWSLVGTLEQSEAAKELAKAAKRGGSARRTPPTAQGGAPFAEKRASSKRSRLSSPDGAAAEGSGRKRWAAGGASASPAVAVGSTATGSSPPEGVRPAMVSMEVQTVETCFEPPTGATGVGGPASAQYQPLGALPADELGAELSLPDPDDMNEYGGPLDYDDGEGASMVAPGAGQHDVFSESWNGFPRGFGMSSGFR